MKAPEYLLITWAVISLCRLAMAWYQLKMHKNYLLFPLLHVVAIITIVVSKNYIIGLTISAFANIIFYWWAKPKYLAD